MRALQKLGAMSAVVSLLVLGSAATEGNIAKADTLLDESGELLSGDAILDDGSLYDQYTFDGDSGQYVTISLESDEFDPYLILLDPNGERISENDDINRANRNSRLVVNLPSSGLYTAVANSYESGNSGEYDIKVQVDSTRAGLMQILAAATVPNSTSICQSAIINGAERIEGERALEVSVSSVTLERLYADVPANRTNGVNVALSGPAALSVMFSPEMLLSVANELVDNCDSVGAVVFSSDASEFERTYGVVRSERTNRQAGRRTRPVAETPVAEEFVCTSSLPSQGLPNWGEKACL